MAVPTSSTTSYPTARFASIGQSLAAFLYYSHAGYAFKTKFAEIMRGSSNDAIVDGGIEIAPYSTGGSWASKANRDAAGSTSSAYHYDDTGGTPAGYGTAGVCFDARTKMNARDASNKVVHLLADQGQADSAATSGTINQGTLTVVQGATNWYNAWTNLITGYRQYLNNSTTGLIGWVVLGRSLSNTDTLAYERIRQKQLALITANTSPNTVKMFKAVESWDLELGDSVHPSQDGQTVYGERLAEAVAKNCYSVTSYTNSDGDSVTIYAGPTIASVSLAGDDVTVTVTLTQEGSDTIDVPSLSGPPPCGFAFWDASANMDAVFSSSSPPPVQRPTNSWSWSSGSKTLTFTLATQITGTIAMAFPYDNIADFNPDTVIKGSTSDKPLQSWAR